MKYPASKHYSHLDLSEPIPEIEPRYDEYKRELMKRIVPFAIVSFFVIVVAFVVIQSTRVPIFVSFWFMAIASLLLVLPQAVVGTKLRKRKLGHLKHQNSTDHWGVPIHQQVFYQVYFFIVLVVLMQLPSIAGGFSSLGLFVGIYMIIGGLYLAIATRFMRQPGQISCEKCAYPLVGLRLPCECPECGISLRDLTYTTDRPKVRDPRYLYAGLLLVFLGGLFFYTMLKHKSRVYSVLPSGGLIALAPNSTDAFEALQLKSLTPEEDDKLEDALINAIESGNTAGFWSHAQGSWLAARAFNGELTDAQFDRLMSALGEPSIDAPDVARAGEQVPVILVAPDVRFPSYDFMPSYYFSGYQLSTGGGPLLRSDSPRRWRPLLTGEATSDPDGSESPYIGFTPEAPGEITIRATLVLVLYPGSTELSASGFAWQPDGSFTFVNPPIWSRVIDLEHTIEVTE